jgi:hypothetical protein
MYLFSVAKQKIWASTARIANIFHTNKNTIFVFTDTLLHDDLVWTKTIVYRKTCRSFACQTKFFIGYNEILRDYIYRKKTLV